MAFAMRRAGVRERLAKDRAGHPAADLDGLSDREAAEVAALFLLSACLLVRWSPYLPRR